MIKWNIKKTQFQIQKDYVEYMKDITLMIQNIDSTLGLPIFTSESKIGTPFGVLLNNRSNMYFNSSQNFIETLED